MASSKIKTKFGVTALASFLAVQALAAVPAAASLASVDGPVMVNQGAGFAPVTDKTVLYVGDRILARKGAHAKLLYANGCVVALKPGSLVTVKSTASCKATGSSLVADTGDQAQPTGGIGRGSVALVVVGVAAVGVGAAVAAGGSGGKVAPVS